MRFALLALLLLAGCGPSSEVRFAFELTLSRATADLVSGFQVAVVSNGRSLDCVEVQTNCLAAQAPAWPTSQLLELSGASGSGKAVFFPLSLDPGSTSAQQIVLEGIPPGKDLAVVIEALSKDSPRRLVGSSCNYVQEIVSGRNERLIAATIVPLSPLPSCDPSL